MVNIVEMFSNRNIVFLISVPNLFMNGLAVLSLLILMLFFKAEYRRLLAEQRIEAERILHLEKEFQTWCLKTGCCICKVEFISVYIFDTVDFGFV